MLYLYLDESGDLGFDFQNKKPSRFFTITVLVINGEENNKFLHKAVKKTLQRKLNSVLLPELKGCHTSIEIKKYFYNQISSIEFGIYAATLDKTKIDPAIIQKDRLYNFIAHNVLHQISFENASNKIYLIVDKCKNKREIEEFNKFIIRQLEGQINPLIPFRIFHNTSHENLGLQAADLFAWAIHRRYEKNDSAIFDMFKNKVRYDEKYLK